MKKTAGILLKSTSFVAAFFILLNVFSFVFTPKDGKEYGSVYGADSYKAEAENTIDIFFVGNSNISSAVVPPVIWKETGLSACVSGKANQSVKGAYKTVKDMYKHQSPSVVVIETDMVFAGQGRHFNKEYLSDLFGTIKSLASIVLKNFEDSVMSGMSYNFPVFKHHERWSRLSSEDITNMKKRCKSKYCGYNADFTINGHDGGFDYMHTRVDDSVITAKRADELKKIIKLCKENNSKVILLDVPCASSWSQQRHDEMSAFAKQNGLEFIDMNVTIPDGFDWALDSRDAGVHLNTFGAHKVSTFMGDYLSDITDNEKSHSFADTKEWQQIEKQYESEYETMCREVKL